MKEVFDAHVHHLFEMPIEEAIAIFKEEFPVTGTVGQGFMSIPNNVSPEKEFYFDDMQNIRMLFLKYAFSPNAYAFSGLEHPLNVAEIDDKTVSDMYLKQAQEYALAGYDGMKMLEGYPSLRKVMKRKLCDKAYDNYYSFLEENGIPVTMHVANPEENWDITKVSEAVIKAGRVYDHTYPTRLELLSEVEEVLKKHPKLKFSLAHFGFMSYDIEQAKRWLDYENTMFDLTPGGEQLLNMRKDWENWEKFFVEYQDRIIHGTDYYAFPKTENWEECFKRRPTFVRQFFETDGDHVYVDRPFKGVKLDEKIVDKIYSKNVKRFWGEPKKIDLNYMKRKAEEILRNENHHAKYAEHDLKFILKELNEK